MIKKFRTRFIHLAMSALLAVLALVIAGINIYNYHETREDADDLLRIISYNRGRFPEEIVIPEEDQIPKDINGSRRHGRKDLGGFSPETPYETRYFSVGINNETQEADMVDTSRIVAVNEQKAEQMAREALEDGGDSGYVGKYRFYVARARLHTYVVFVDCGRALEAAGRFLVGSIIISAAGFILVFVIVSLLSRYAIRPVTTSYEKQKQFISNAGHEIKTPLSIIRADADILEMDLGENEWVSDIRKQVQRLTDLTEELSKLSRMDESEQPIPMKPLDLSKLVSEQVASFKTVAKTRELTLTDTVQPELTMQGNEKALRQLCSVLLDNAVKYSREGSEIRLSLEGRGKNIHLSVSNLSKHPLPTKDLEQLFERFYRTDPSRNSETGGFGIGLSIAKAIVQGHNGTICADSPDGASFCMEAILPAT